MAAALAPLHFPKGAFSTEFLHGLTDQLLAIASAPNVNYATVLPVEQVQGLIKRSTAILRKEPALIEILPSDGVKETYVVGDTHGQFPDVCEIIKITGYPSTDKIIIFNGDFVDRGSWGLENMMLYMAWKVAMPHNVFLMRGNHETSYCTQYYGFLNELKAKYLLPAVAAAGKPQAEEEQMKKRTKPGKDLSDAFMRMFTQLPIAALVANTTLIMHGGLFRRPHYAKAGSDSDDDEPQGSADTETSKGSWYNQQDGPAPKLGRIEHLRKSTKGGKDPDEDDYKVVHVADLLWGDPVPTNGLKTNVQRGIGLKFGPDITERFCRKNRIKLIVRSHEGPDARDQRSEEERMNNMLQGWSVDHDTPSGKLVTVFSAPDYPQHMPAPRFNNTAAVLLLTPPDWATPQFIEFEAYRPRPQGGVFYDLELPGSDEERISGWEVTSQASEATDGTAAQGQQRQHDDVTSPEPQGPSAAPPAGTRDAATSTAGPTTAAGQDAKASSGPEPEAGAAVPPAGATARADASTSPMAAHETASQQQQQPAEAGAAAGAAHKEPAPSSKRSSRRKAAVPTAAASDSTSTEEPHQKRARQ